jgi:predicted ATPase
MPPPSAYALHFTTFVQIFCGNHATATAQSDALVALAREKGSALWEGMGVGLQGSILALVNGASEATEIITSGIRISRSTGLKLWMPFWLSSLAKAHADVGQFDNAWRHISEAMTTIETSKERMFEAELNRVAGEIARKSPESEAVKAEAYFERALTVARQQLAKSWELRAAMSLARLWHDQGKRRQAHELLAPVYGWFTEGFDTLDLKQAKTLLDELNV